MICGINYHPELVGVGKYSGETAEWLAARGHEVRMVTAPPYYPYWKIQPGFSRWTYSIRRENGVRVTRCPIYVPKTVSGIKRLLHLASFAVSSAPALFAAIWWRPNVVIAIEPTLMAAPVVLLIARLSGAKGWLHIQDFEVAAAFELGVLSRFKGLHAVARSVEGWLMRRFDGVSAISGKMAQRCSEVHRVATGKVHFVSNWSNSVSGQDERFDGSRFKLKHGIEVDDILLLYSGNMGEKQGLEVVLDVAAMSLAHPNVKYVLAGNGGTRDWLQASAAARKLTNVSFLPLQEESEFAHMLAAADIHLVVQKAEAADLVLPSKVTNILATGGAMIVTAEPQTELGQLADNFGIAVRVPPAAPAELFEAVLALSNSKTQRDALGLAARDYACKYLVKDDILLKLEAKLLHLSKGI